jgi:hypothetical protein
MYWLIEDVEKIELLCEKKHKQAYVEIIPTSPTLHPSQNQVCALFVRPLKDTKGYIIPIKHSETINLDIEVCKKVLNSIEEIYVRDKKEFLHYFALKHLLHPPPSLNTYILQPTKSHTHIQNNTNITHTNTIIPIVKHYEVCNENYKNHNFELSNNFYNNKVPLVFNMLEQSGIKVNTTLYKHYFGVDTEEYVYTQYNLNTLTTRPSNTFGGINFSALNKDTGERECFIPRNDIFIEMDISAYHPTLLGNILDYSFDNSDVHNSFAKMYGVEYAKAKEITFKQLYGGIFKQYEDLPFFSKVKAFTQEIWKEFEQKGYIECPISKYRFEKDKLKEMNPQKLLNYLLQNLETSTNVLILYDIFKILRGKNTKLVLYVYDSFLLDTDKKEKDTIKEILEVFKKYKLNVKFKTGKNYNLK